MNEKELNEILDEIKNNSKNNSEKSQSSSNFNSDSDSFDNSKTRNTSISEGMFNITDISDDNTSVGNNDNKTEEEKVSDYAAERSKKRAKKKIEKKKKKKKKGFLIAFLILLAAAAASAGVYFAMTYDNSSSDVTSTKSAAAEDSEIVNPLTGESGYNEDAVGKRPVAVVVENEYSTEAVRPQWGINDADITLEGESEYSTRLLLIWADYTDMPDQIGPVRSARPSFIYFSQLFNCVFIHAGLSHSKGDYIGADTVFETENIDHINGLNYISSDTANDGSEYFGRNYTRTNTSEHTAYLNGAQVASLLDETQIDTELDSNSFTQLNFNKTITSLSDNTAESCSFEWSDSSQGGICPKTGTFTYDFTSQKYVTTDFDSQYGTAEVEYENLIFLLDKTEYVVKENYSNSGESETYCNYSLSGGEGKVFSNNSYVNITWGVENGKLWLKTEDGEDLYLNPGKSYIGYGSSNHGGEITVNPQNDE